ncbi:sensor histidine kinase [Pseudalkalibacillus salsuginis]|uniref:sensor histidine kinase n=1 Tax=Pseudalkalibacillus salsuginis TaxID=2910972 RepID=UPI001F31C459|nr:HAMP domain-containing sensor histidine kinase [Pseudalkalibacillus salsuginis]MCF6411434.1 HAMP domain-containing histidine kinase [Pseudalkalibacillus salsuginis]
MKFMLRIALQLLSAFFLLFTVVQAIVIAAIYLIWPEAGADENSLNRYAIFVQVLCGVLFLLTLLVTGWYLGRPIYFIIVWIKRLANGQYDTPLRWEEIRRRKSGSLKIPYSVYREVFEHLQILAATLQKNEEDLRESERAKEEWIRGISHDLKTPLTYITGYSTILMNQEYNLTEVERREYLSIIEQKAIHLQELVHDLNENIQGQLPLKKEKSDLIELVRRAVADISSAPWANGHQFTMDSDQRRIIADIDPKLLTRAIRNLLVNAVIHNPEGTEIAVFISVEKGNTAECRIRDNGVGFIESGVQVDAATIPKREGLGLSIAKQIIHAHGGELKMSSRPNEGTSITIKLQVTG